MGMTGGQSAMLIGSIVGPMLAGAFSPDGQERQSFENTDSDPKALMKDNRALLDSIMPLIMGRANAGVSLPSAVVQQPGAATGGGLPMPIGLTASDPALSNPGLLKIPGLSVGDFKMPSRSPIGVPTGPGAGGDNPPGAGMGPGDTFFPGSDVDPDGPLGPDAPLGDAFDDFYLPKFDQRGPENPQGTTDGGEPTPRNNAEKRAGPRRRSDAALFDDGALINPGNDLQQALGSVQLLLDAYR